MLCHGFSVTDTIRHHASPSPFASHLISSFSAYSSQWHFCSQANSWTKLMSFCLNLRAKKSWHTLTLICPDPPFNSKSVCSPFVFHLRRADDQVLMLDIPSCSLELVRSVCIQQKGVSYLCVCLLRWRTEMTWTEGGLTRSKGIAKLRLKWSQKRSQIIFGCFNNELCSVSHWLIIKKEFAQHWVLTMALVNLTSCGVGYYAEWSF